MMKRLKLILAGQLRRPEGPFGKLLSQIMNVVNAKQYELTFKVLEIHERDHILEIGFGNGKCIQRAAKSVSEGFVAGADNSQTMVKEAIKRNKVFIKKGIVEIKSGSVYQIPYENEMFDKVYTINTIYFWSSPEEAFKEIYRVLKPGGKIFVTFNSRDTMRWIIALSADYVIYKKQDVMDMLMNSGFKDIKLYFADGKLSDANCVIGVRKE